MSKQTIHLTEGPPIEIDDAEWPVIARTSVWYGAETMAAARDRAYVRVRQHRDGRYIVYGLRSEGGHQVLGGFLAAGYREVTEAISKTCALIGVEDNDVFADMPAVQA